jgi:hypothetical protein
MFDEFDGLDATAKAGIGATLNSVASADTVAKVRNRPMTIFPPKDDPTNDRRSLQPQTRYRGRP